jgi:hypothetical protein
MNCNFFPWLTCKISIENIPDIVNFQNIMYFKYCSDDGQCLNQLQCRNQPLLKTLSESFPLVWFHICYPLGGCVL